MGAAIVIVTIIALSYTVIRQRQQIDQLNVEIKITQAITIGYVKAYAKCFYQLKQLEESFCR